jgi:Family of unknown function (DUF6134)
MRFLVMLVAMVMAPMQAMAQPWQPAHGTQLAFDVLRDGGPLGTHVVSFARSGDELTVKSAVALKVTFGPITFFDYAHDVTEKYLGSQLTWVGSRTKKDGKWQTLSAEAVEGGLAVKGSAFKGMLKGLVIPSTHWNADEMKQPGMFSTETGKMLPMKVVDRGIEKVKAGGTTIEARRFDVSSELNASFWYDAQGRWVKCAFVAEGSKIEYVLRKLPD